jgi:hypothetical protein
MLRAGLADFQFVPTERAAPDRAEPVVDMTAYLNEVRLGDRDGREPALSARLMLVHIRC